MNDSILREIKIIEGKDILRVIVFHKIIHAEFPRNRFITCKEVAYLKI